MRPSIKISRTLLEILLGDFSLFAPHDDFVPSVRFWRSRFCLVGPSSAMILGRLPHGYTVSGIAGPESWPTRSYKDKNGERQKRTEWHKIVRVGQTAEIAPAVSQEGFADLYRRPHPVPRVQDKEGQKRTSFEIVAKQLRMLGVAPKALQQVAWRRSGTFRGDDFETHAAPADDSYGGAAPSTGGPESPTKTSLLVAQPTASPSRDVLRDESCCALQKQAHSAVARILASNGRSVVRTNE